MRSRALHGRVPSQATAGTRRVRARETERVASCKVALATRSASRLPSAWPGTRASRARSWSAISAASQVAVSTRFSPSAAASERTSVFARESARSSRVDLREAIELLARGGELGRARRPEQLRELCERCARGRFGARHLLLELGHHGVVRLGDVRRLQRLDLAHARAARGRRAAARASASVRRGAERAARSRWSRSASAASRAGPNESRCAFTFVFSTASASRVAVELLELREMRRRTPAPAAPLRRSRSPRGSARSSAGPPRARQPPAPPRGRSSADASSVSAMIARCAASADGAAGRACRRPASAPRSAG